MRAMINFDNNNFFLGPDDPKHKIIQQNIKDGIAKIEALPKLEEISGILSDYMKSLKYKMVIILTLKKEDNNFR